jgi:predicted DNA-binding protein
MTKKKEQPEEKQPIEMTSEELLDYALAPEVAERVKELVRESQEAESDDFS